MFDSRHSKKCSIDQFLALRGSMCIFDLQFVSPTLKSSVAMSKSRYLIRYLGMKVPTWALEFPNTGNIKIASFSIERKSKRPGYRGWVFHTLLEANLLLSKCFTCTGTIRLRAPIKKKNLDPLGFVQKKKLNHNFLVHLFTEHRSSRW